MGGAQITQRVLYKYMREKYARRFVEEGVIRIGTLYEYRDTESHDTRVGDDAEGRKSAVMPVSDMTITDQEEVPEFVRDRIKIGTNTRVRMINSKFAVSEESPDFYVYSLAAEYSEALMRDFEYDACVRIEDPEQFLDELNACFRPHGEFIGLHRCVYMPREVSHTEQHAVHPALIKEPHYSNQKELRAIWKPKKDDVLPVVLECPKLSQWCSIV